MKIKSIFLMFITVLFLSCTDRIIKDNKSSESSELPITFGTSEPSKPDDEHDPDAIPFAYKSLKDWTNAAFGWDEAKKGARDAVDFLNTPLQEGKYIAFEELILVLKSFAEKAVTSALADKSKWLNNKAPEEDQFFKVVDGEIYGYGPPDYFAQKVRLKPNHEIVVMGDFHGSLHSLLRNLWRLHKLGYLSNNFKLLRSDVSFIFTGDFIDRGRYGSEILYTLFRLKLANWHNVHLIRGNHEEEDIASQYGFKSEILTKYVKGLKGIKPAEELFRRINNTFRFLPVVFFAQLEKDNNLNNIHFSHGGYGFNLNNKTLAHDPKPLLLASNIVFEKLPDDRHYGYQWTDFQQDQDSSPSARGFAKMPELGAFTSGLKDLEAYLVHNNLRAIFRGHQDKEFGLKLLFKDYQNVKISNAQNNTSLYKDGPYHWSDVLEDHSLISSVREKGLPLTIFAPVFTFTTASEGQAVPFDSFGIILCKEKWEDYRLLVHEISLPATRPDLAYVDISPKRDPLDDEIHVDFKGSGPGRCLLD